jgi:sugar phosphate isomerase/epimerase
MKHVSLYLQLTLIILLSFGVTANGYTRNKTTEIASDFDKIGWKVGIQSYTFTRYSLFDAIDAAADLGLKYVEATIWQTIERGKEERFNPWQISEETKQKIKNKCKEKGVTLTSFYCRPSKEDAENGQTEKLFQFCKEWKMALTTDPVRIASGPGSMDFYDKLCQKYGVYMFLTNHPKAHGSPYWNPEDVLADCKDRSKYIGASVDVGHFMRDGTNVYEVVKRYTDAGRMYHFHFRDVDRCDKNGKDVTLGEGAAQIKELLTYLNKKRATPIIVFEYERDQDEPLKYITPGVVYLRQLSKELLKNKQADNNNKPIKLWARNASTKGGLNICDKDKDTLATIHGWNNTEQQISWKTFLKKGNYTVCLKYSEPYQGSAITVTAGQQQFATLIQPTAGWNEYHEKNLGVIRVPTTGETNISLQGIQLSLVKDEKGKLVHKEALPDIQYLSLIPTKEKSVSSPINILQEFKGKPIFNGKTFKGWTGNNGKESMKWFRIEEGAIIGGNTEMEIPQNEFLRSDREYGNFELRLKFKINCADDSYNAGIQFRSQPQTEKGKEHEMIGYQADIISWKKGALYDEQRRWDFLGNPLAKNPTYNAREWNSYIIRCEGPRVRIWLNGIQTLDYFEPFVDTPHPDVQIGRIPQIGYIALQIHEGKACEALYKDITIEEL